MKYFEIKESETYRILNSPYNPPPLHEKEVFHAGWHATRKTLKELLDYFGKWDAYEEGDYYLSDAANDSRVISIVLSSHRMMTPIFFR